MTSNLDGAAGPLWGKTVALPETRELDLFASMLEAKGAATLRCPLIAILDAPDPAPVLAWLDELTTRGFDDVILLTGEGLRRLMAAARTANRDEQAIVDALGRARRITRGPKPARALRELGLAPDLPAEVPTSAGVIAMLAEHDLNGRRVGVQLYAQDPNEALMSFLAAAGATALPVWPYVYAPASDGDRVAEMLRKMADGLVDVLAFTSSPQVDRLWTVAQERSLMKELEHGLARTKIAAVGPIVAENLRGRGVPIAFAPENSFFLRPLVTAIVQGFAAP